MIHELRILILEDDAYDARLAIAQLEAAGYACRWQRVETRAEFLVHLEAAVYDVILADYSLPDFDGLTALRVVRAQHHDLPFILVSGQVGEEAAIESLKAGATDYVLKDRLTRLGPVVARALHEMEEQRKREQAEELLIQRSKLESLGELAAGIAHEINQPLAGISMGAENILFKFTHDMPAPQGYVEAKLKSILDYVQRIKQIIDHIRTFSREQSSERLETINVNAVCRNAVSMIQAQYRQHYVTVALNLAEPIEGVRGNQYRLEQVLLNLLTNAKFAVEQKARESSGTDYAKQITITTSCGPAGIYMDVEDNGIGIPPEQQERIFDPFFTTKDPEHGTGLGLSVSYGIIKDMGGDLSVESEPGRFTRLRIALPKA